jgi:hypothetical protein
MNAVVWLGSGASVVQLVAYGLYNRQIFRGTSTPNATTWALWAFLSTLAAASYAVMTDDFAKYILPVASGLANIATFIYALFAGKFRRIGWWDWPVLLLGMLGGFVWWQYQSATYANLIIVAAEAIAFIPTYRHLWKNSALERSLPWFIWTAAYFLNGLVVVLRWNGHYQDLVNPVTMFFLHLIVGLMALRKTQTPEPDRPVSTEKVPFEGVPL